MKIKKAIFITALALLTTPLIAKTINVNHCTDASRECMIKAGSTYLDAITSHDASKIPFAINVERWENGVKTAENAAKLRYSLENDYAIKSVKGIRDLRWYVDGNDLLALYLIDVVIPYTNIYVGTTRMAERFHVVNGLIDDVEVIFCNSFTKTPEETKMKNKIPFVCNRSAI